MGHVVHGRGEPAAVRRVPETVSEHTQDTAGPASGPAGQPDHQLSHQDVAAVRVRETSSGRGMGGDQHRGPDQRYTVAVDLLSAVPPVSALFHPAPGPVQGQNARVAGERVQTRVAAQPGDTDQFQGFRQTLIP